MNNFQKSLAIFFSMASIAIAADSVAAQQYLPPTESLLPAVQKHVDMAYLLLNGEVSEKFLPHTFFDLIPHPAGARTPYQVMEDRAFVIASQAFDQLYYVGWNYVGTWVLKTGDGLILFGTMSNAKEAEEIIVGGLKKLGLDPNTIKYIVVSHGHKDHYGGVNYLKEKYHAQVLLTAVDANMPPAPAAPNATPFPPMPPHDIDIVDGQNLTLGGTTVTMYVTPGHTPGTVSVILPVTDHGEKHTLLLWSGTGLPEKLGPGPRTGGLREYEASLWRITKIGIDANVDGLIAAHPIADGTDVKAALAAARKLGAPNPWVIGQNTFIRYMAAFIEATQAMTAFQESKGEK